mmetsp:Transcript_65800/g.146130  ORF Transcript_65800/g.146130 Transcript_65800/m.146130 type:complete len:616 (+) Transcript_65800:40-1887(+)
MAAMQHVPYAPVSFRERYASPATTRSATHPRRTSYGDHVFSGAWAPLAAPIVASLTALRTRQGRGPSRSAKRLARQALSWRMLSSAQSDLEAAVAELRAAAASAGPASFGLLSVPSRWAADVATLSTKLKEGGVCAGAAPLIGVVQDTKDAAAPLRMLLGNGGAARAFFVNKEELSQAGAGLAKENPIPGVPDGPHASVLLFADSKVPGSLTRNLLEALDARYPAASKAGVLVRPAAKAEQDAADGLQDWEPAREGRQLRTRDRSDGHGWVKSDPVFSTLEGVSSATTAEFKKRPFGVKRYTPGYEGKGAMVIDMQEKSRYPGDAMGQVAVGGVRIGMVLKSVGGQDVSQWDFEDIMDLLNDQGIMDPDSKSAASWGDAGKGIQRQPVEEAALPVTIEFGTPNAGAGASEAPLCLDSVPRRDGVVGVALGEAFAASLGLAGFTRMGPALQVAKAGANPEGAFVVEAISMQGQAMPAASALKGAAKAAGLTSMKGLCLGIQRPGGGSVDAAQWALFPMAGVSKTGGIVLRCKGLSAEGLGPDDSLKEVQFFAPSPTGVAGAMQELLGRVPNSALALCCSEEAMAAAPTALPLMGPALIGNAGTGTTIHRQAVAVVA